MKKANEMTIVEAARALRARAFTVRDLWNATRSVAEEKNDNIFAYLELFDTDDTAIDNAQKRIDTEGDEAPILCGIPIAVKDNILIKGKTASASSKMLENYEASYTATVIEKMRAEGALFLGRTNMDEFAMGSSTETSAFGKTKNPHDTNRVPGGSSGGSAAATSAHMTIASIGSDTGGSIRQPASLTGVVGLKPTYGAVSRYGLMSMGSSLDQVGPLTKTVDDSEVLFKALRGRDEKDSTTIPDDLYPKREVNSTLRIGVPRTLLEKGVDEDVLKRFNETLEALKLKGHTIVDVSLPTNAYALPIYYIIMPAEASTNFARYDGMRYGLSKHGKTLLDDYIKTRSEGFGPEVQRRILLGAFVLSSGYIDAYYRKAHSARSVLVDEFNSAFENVDVIATPTSPSPAFRFGEKSNDPVAMYIEDIFTVTANLTGMPAISVPMKMVERDEKSLPIGIQFTAPHQAENVLFAVGRAVENTQLD
ncbi:Aspartyl-tRNA(Asn) amidotransferase subunit A @ Glutamyl-tRNA(Gln) amidotransferase subunit A [hydrothermal vent metagenome]|uniref:glutaminyl-tRNA synthase (glutamine-hydrolyzing) n=1 Tax=hydrothermal vent metagenome TaxID=652676 RepID=A0A3B0UWW0_9ZZZZ